MSNLKRTSVALLAFALLGLPAVPHSASAQTQTGTKTYQVTVTNINSGKQGLSPLVIATHPASAHIWQMGQAASPGLELLAEEGMPTLIASELQGKATDVGTTSAHLLPGDSITVRVRANQGDVLSAGTMLIQTNDGFTGLDSVPLSTASTDAMAYDAGTEENTEKKSDVPGPPFGGMKAGPDQSPKAAVAAHEGIKGTADVTPDFNWTGPVARFTIRAVATTTAPAAPTAPPAAPVSPAATPTPAPVSQAAPATGASTAPAESMPNMPKTGGAEESGTSPWLPIAFVASLLLVIAGLTTRRAFAGRR